MNRIVLAAAMLAGSSLPAMCAGYDDLNIGISYFDQARYDDAITWFSKAIAAGDLIPDLMRLAYLDRGQANSKKGDKQQAIADYTAAIAARPDDLFVYRARSDAYLGLNDFDGALADYNSLAKLRPYDYVIQMNVGLLSWQLGRMESSASAFSYFSNEDTYAWLWLQLANARLGKPLTAFSDDADSKAWPGDVARFYRGRLSEADVLEAAESVKGGFAVCDAHIFTGLWRLVHGDQAGAAALLKIVKEKCSPEESSIYRRIAQTELDKMASGEKAK